MTIGDLLVEYDLRRAAAESAARERRARAIRTVPGLAELQEQRGELFGCYGNGLLEGGGIDRAAVARRAAELEARESELLARAGITGLEPAYQCEKCRDTGYAGGEMCDCLRERIYTRVLGGRAQSELAASFESFDISLYSGEHAERAKLFKEICKDYAEEYPRLSRPNILLIGTSGLGKTFLLECIARELAKKTRDIAFLGATQLFEGFWRHRLGGGQEAMLVMDARVLIIDDLGAEPLTQNVTREYLLRLADHRLRARLPLLIASNLDAAGLKARYGEPAVSRLTASDMCHVMRLTGEDIRAR